MQSLLITLAKSGMSPLSMPTFWKQIQTCQTIICKEDSWKKIMFRTFAMTHNHILHVPSI